MSRYILLAMLFLWINHQASASCLLPAYELVWSYPANGEDNVPTNSMIWVLPSVRVNGPATINGMPLTPGYLPFSFETDLQPNTVYEISVASQFDSNEKITFSFTTGSNAQDEPTPEAPIVTSIQATTERNLTAQCQDVLWAQDCYDTGQDTHVILNVQSDAFSWIVEEINGQQIYWPSVCGAPEFFTWVNPWSPEQSCYYLTAVDQFGRQAKSGPHCLESAHEMEDVADPDIAEESDSSHNEDTLSDNPADNHASTEESSGSCSISQTKQSIAFPWVLGIIFMYWIWRRKNNALI